MKKEYDFRKAERGKFYRPLDKGYTVHVTKKDGTIEVKQYTLAEGTILLAPDVAEYFPDSKSVNEALRSLIQLMEKVPARKYKRSSPADWRSRAAHKRNPAGEAVLSMSGR